MYMQIIKYLYLMGIAAAGMRMQNLYPPIHLPGYPKI
jgi:hypothetical protein